MLPSAVHAGPGRLSRQQYKCYRANTPVWPGCRRRVGIPATKALYRQPAAVKPISRGVLEIRKCF